MAHPFPARSFLKYRITFLALFQSHWTADNRFERCCDLKGRAPTAGRVSEWGGDGLVPAFCRQDGVLRGRHPYPPLLAHFLEHTYAQTVADGTMRSSSLTATRGAPEASQ